MYIWLRMMFMFGVCLWQSKGKRRTSPWEPHTYTTRAYPVDLDFNLHVTNGRINTLTDLGRLHYFIRTGLLQYALSQGARPLVGDITSKFRREIKVFDKVVIQTRLLGWEGKWAFIEHRLLRGGRVIGNVVMRGMFKGKQGPILPEKLLEVFQESGHRHSPVLPQWVLDWHQSMEGMSQELRAEEALGAN